MIHVTGIQDVQWTWHSWH